MRPPELYAMIAIRQHRLNQAVGIMRPTAQILGLLSLYQAGQEQAPGSHLITAIRWGKRRIKELLKRAEQGQIAPGVLQEAKDIEHLLSISAKLLEAI